MDDALRALLGEIDRFGQTHDGQTSDRKLRMNNITPDTGDFLAILIMATRAKRVLEIGTSNGYSTIWLADAARSISSSVVTVELLDWKFEMARANLERAGVASWVRQVQGDAGEFLNTQPESSVDLLFLDSDRTQYVSWWPAIQRVVVPGGLLVVDNAVSHPAEMEPFVACVSSTPKWRSVVVPVGKGEFVAYKSPT